MPITIKELNHVALHVRDLNASVHFYADILNLPRLLRPNFEFPGAWLALGAQELHLIEDLNLPPDERRHHHFALLVEDTYAIRAELERKGVTSFISHAPRVDGAIQLFLFDPDGYRIELVSAVLDALQQPAGTTEEAG